MTHELVFGLVTTFSRVDYDRIFCMLDLKQLRAVNCVVGVQTIYHLTCGTCYRINSVVKLCSQITIWQHSEHSDFGFTSTSSTCLCTTHPCEAKEDEPIHHLRQIWPVHTNPKFNKLRLK